MMTDQEAEFLSALWKPKGVVGSRNEIISGDSDVAGPKSDRESSESSFHPTARPLRMPYRPEQMNDTSGSRSTATDHD